jgi:hypothetical protein
MAPSLFNFLIYSLAIGAAVAIPAPSKQLSHREAAGIPLSNIVIPVRKIKAQGEVTPVGAPYRYFRALEEAGGDAIGTGIARNAADQIEYITEVTIGGTNYSLIIDTGSSDTWVAREPFSCYDVQFRVPMETEACEFGPFFKGEYPLGQIEELSFEIYYGDGNGPFLRGSMGYSE